MNESKLGFKRNEFVGFSVVLLQTQSRKMFVMVGSSKESYEMRNVVGCSFLELFA